MQEETKIAEEATNANVGLDDEGQFGNTTTSPAEEVEQSDEEVKEANEAEDDSEDEPEDEDPQEGLDPEEGGEDEELTPSEGDGVKTPPEEIPEGFRTPTPEEMKEIQEFEATFGGKSPLKVLVQMAAQIKALENKVF